MDTKLRTEPVQASLNLQSIVVPISGLDLHERAVDVGASVARRFGVPLRLITLRYLKVGEYIDERHFDAIRSRFPDVAIETEIEYGNDPANWIVSLTRVSGALVCVASGNSGIDLPGSVTAALLRYAAAPVLMVGPHISKHWSAEIDHITVPVRVDQDLSSVLDISSRVATATAARIELVSVIDPDDVKAARRFGIDADESAFVHRVALEMTPPASWEVLHGSPASALVRYTEERADSMLIVMASKSRASDHPHHGGKTVHVVHDARCPVLVVPAI